MVIHFWTRREGKEWLDLWELEIQIFITEK